MADERLRDLMRRARNDRGAAAALAAEMQRLQLRPAQRGRIWIDAGVCRWCLGAHHDVAFTGAACEGSGVVRQVFVRNEPLENPEPGRRARLMAPHPETGELVESRPVYRDEVTEPHAPGTRGRICTPCHERLFVRTPGRAYTSRWTNAARNAIAAALKTSACRAPEGLEAAVRAAKPWAAYSAGNGMAWANQVWTREKGRALRAVGAGAPVVGPDDAGPLFGEAS